MARWNLVFADRYVLELRAMHAFARARIHATVTTLLGAEPTRQSKHRKSLRLPISWCPEATWELRIGEHRVLYRCENDTVVVLRVRLKARRSTEEMGPG